MAGFDKKWLFIHVPATFVVAGLIMFGVSKCNRLEDAEATRDSASDAANLATDKLNQAIAKMDSLFVVQDSLKNVGVKKSDTIRQLKKDIVIYQDSIVELNDSIKGLNKSLKKKDKALKTVKAELDDCKRNQAAATNNARRSNGVNNRTVVRAERPVDTCSNTAARVRVNSSENSGNIIVTGVDNASVVLENNAVNSGNIIVGNGNNIQIFGTSDVRVVSDSVVARVNQPVVRDSIAPQNDSIVCTFGWRTVVVNTR